jgi:hypothetical protein
MRPNKKKVPLCQLATRVPLRIYEELNKEAEENRRNMSNQLLVILEERYPDVSQS